MAVIAMLTMTVGCRYYEAGKHAAVSAVVTSIVRLQSHAPLTQNSVARPARDGHGRRLVALRQAPSRTAQPRCTNRG